MRLSIVRGIALALCLAVVARFAFGCAQLVAWPFDWDPGEGLSLDYARRLLRAPGTLYPRDTVVPYPLVYTPLLTAVLAPVVAWSSAPLQSARAVLLGFAALAGASAFSLGRRAARAEDRLAAGALAVALLFCAVGHSFWFAMVRTDGPMIALWLAAAAVALPERGSASGSREAGEPDAAAVEKGARDDGSVRGGALSWRRAWVGGALLVLAVLAKPTAALLGAPIVLGWLAVDRASAIRLGAATVALGALSFGALELATAGGFLRCLALQLDHAQVPGQSQRLLLGWLLRHGPLLALGLVAALLLVRRRDTAQHPSLRRGGSVLDPALLLWLAGPLSLPLLGKSGAIFVYLLPWACGQAVLVARWLARLGAPGLLAGAVVAALVSVTQTFPLPSPEDARTAQSFYAFVRERGAPLLASNPDLAYFAVGQPVDIEGSSFPFLAEHREPGIQQVLEGVRDARYRLIIEKSRAGRIVAPAYEAVGACDLGYFLGTLRFTLLVPRGSGVRFARAEGDRCAVLEPRR